MPKIETENALVLSVKRYSEHAFIAHILTQEHGHYAGLIRAKRPPQTGSFISGQWQARLSEQLGQFYVEEKVPLAARFLDDKVRLTVLETCCALLEKVVPERQLYPTLFESAGQLLTHLDADDFLKKYVLFERDLLTLLGFGFELTRCVGCGRTDRLTYLSPKTGGAVCDTCGQPYKKGLLPLPRLFFQSDGNVIEAFNVTGFFIRERLTETEIPCRIRLKNIIEP